VPPVHGVAAAVALAAAPLVLGGCTPNPPRPPGAPPPASVAPGLGEARNGEERRAAPDVLADARSALAGVRSVHLLGALPATVLPEPAAAGDTPTAGVEVDLVLTRAGVLSGALRRGAARVQVVRGPDGLYLRGDPALAATLADGYPPPGGVPGDDRYRRLPVAAARGAAALTLALLADRLLAPGPDLVPGVALGDADGALAVLVTGAAAGDVRVANTGQPLPLRVTADGDVLDLGDYDVAVPVTAPPAVSVAP